MLAITYRWPQSFSNILTRFGGQYVFDAANNFTVTPFTWEDFYDIILIDRDPYYRDFVLADDPKAGITDRRIIIDTYVLDPELARKQAENEAREAKIKQRLWFIDKYKKDIFNWIAEWKIESYPATLDADAIAFADERMAELEEPTAIVTEVEAPEEEIQTTVEWFIEEAAKEILDTPEETAPEEVSETVQPENTEDVAPEEVENILWSVWSTELTNEGTVLQQETTEIVEQDSLKQAEAALEEAEEAIDAAQEVVKQAKRKK